MTDDHQGSDRSLLERLNALKPTTVNLDASSKSVAVSTIEPAKPPSREDALSERLKSLRKQSDNHVHPISSLGPSHESGNTTALPSSNPGLQASPGPQNLTTGVDAPQVSSKEAANDDTDPLLYTDDQTLEELLADLESDQQWLEEVVSEEEEHRRVTALLEELGKGSTGDKDLDDIPGASEAHDGNEDEGSSDDDSEGENMTREADDILAQAVDEVVHEKADKPSSHSGSSPVSPSHFVKSSTEDAKADEDAPIQGPNESDPFNLPAVPSDLQDQPGLPDPSQDEVDFAASITSRMAALKVDTPLGPSLPSVPTSEINDLGLPSAPTFAPGDRPAPGLIKRFGYTDEDQKTWCIVCLEDSAIRCLDCDGDVYCARCWKEMHVGPSAGYNERGHRWEKFVRGR